jgi:hypothetical protein
MDSFQERYKKRNMENKFDDLLESDQETLEAEFDKIRDTRLNEILKTLKSLNVIINAYKQFKYEEDTDFSSMMKRIEVFKSRT